MNAPIDAHKLLPVTDGASLLPTHLVKNQASPLTGFNAFEHDAVLSAAVQREAPWATGRCHALGRLVHLRLHRGAQRRASAAPCDLASGTQQRLRRFQCA